MSRWFRFYDTTLDDPKVQRLSDKLYRTWTHVLCIASRYDGKLPSVSDMAFLMRLSDKETYSRLGELRKAGLIDDDPDAGATPHNWKSRQFQSDGSTPRVKRFRERHRNVSSSVSETPPETEQTRTELAAPLSASARTKSDFDVIENRLRSAAGVEGSPSIGLMNLSPILGLIDQGFDLEGEILPAIRAKPKASVASWSYFIPQIRDFRATRTASASAPIPLARAGPNGSKRNPAVAYLERQRENYDESADQPYVAKGISGFG